VKSQAAKALAKLRVDESLTAAGGARVYTDPAKEA
jgi:hypothetical protein